MGTPATAVGTFGKIRHYKDASGYRARPSTGITTASAGRSSGAVRPRELPSAR